MMIVCVKCRKFFRPHKNGVVVEEGMPSGSRLAIVDVVSGWRPYKLWMADLHKCRSCDTEIIAGFGERAFIEHFMPEYEKVREAMPPHLFVPDCI